METIINFLGTHWIWFLVIAILLIFALIGYLVDSNSIELDKPKILKVDNNEDVEVLTTDVPLNQAVKSDVLKQNETIDAEINDEKKEIEAEMIEEENEDVEKFDSQAAEMPKENVVNKFDDYKKDYEHNKVNLDNNAEKNDNGLKQLIEESNSDIATFRK